MLLLLILLHMYIDARDDNEKLNKEIKRLSQTVHGRLKRNVLFVTSMYTLWFDKLQLANHNALHNL